MKKFLENILKKAQDNPKLVKVIAAAVITPVAFVWLNFVSGDGKQSNQVNDILQEPVVQGTILSKDESQIAVDNMKKSRPTGQVVNIGEFIEQNINDSDSTDPLGVNATNAVNVDSSNSGGSLTSYASHSSAGINSPNDAVARVMQGVKNIEDSAKDRTKERFIDSNNEKIIELLQGFTENLEKNSKAIDSLEERLSTISNNITGNNTRPTDSRQVLQDAGGSNSASKQSDSSGNNFTGLHIVKKKATEDTAKKSKSNKSFIRVITDESKTIQNGDVLALRTLDKIVINDIEIAANTRIYALVGFATSRLVATVTSIVTNDKKVMPIKANIFDKDGIPGIACPSVQEVQAMKADVAQNINSVTPDGIILTDGRDVKGALSLKGVDAAFGLGKLFAAMKLTEQKVEIVSGYPLILQIENQN